MERKTYRTQKNAEAEANGKGVYYVKGPPPGWRIKKKHRYDYPMQKSNLGLVKPEIFTAKMVQIKDLIEDYLRTKGVKDNIVRQKSLDKTEINRQWIINILNEKMTSLQNKIADLL